MAMIVIVIVIVIVMYALCGDLWCAVCIVVCALRVWCGVVCIICCLGSNDGGRTVVASNEHFNALMRQAAADLHLAPHLVAGRSTATTAPSTTLWSAGDFEGHEGADKRFYLLGVCAVLCCAVLCCAVLCCAEEWWERRAVIWVDGWFLIKRLCARVCVCVCKQIMVLQIR